MRILDSFALIRVAAALVFAIFLPTQLFAQRSDQQSQPARSMLGTSTARLPQTNPPQDRKIQSVRVAAAFQPEVGLMQANPESITRGAIDEQGAMTLEQLTDLMLANNPQIREADALAAAARGRAYQASRYPNPTVGSAAPQLAGNQSQYNAYMIQDIVTKGKIGLDTAAASRSAREAELAAVRARFDALTLLRQRFYAALAAQRRVEILDNMVSISKRAAEIGERQLATGIGSKGDLDLLLIELAKTQAEYVNAATIAETNRRQLVAATGLYALALPRVIGDLRERLPDYDLLAVQQGVLDRNALVYSAQVEVARNQYLLRRAEVEPFPNLNMMGGYQRQLPGAQAPENQAIYQMQVVVPLYNRNQGNIRAAQANVAAAVAQLERVRNELAASSAAAMGRYLTASQLTDRYEQQILPKAFEVQGIFQQLYNQGQEGFLRYLAAQQALLDANLAYISAQEVRWTAAAEVAGLLQSEQFP